MGVAANELTELVPGDREPAQSVDARIISKADEQDGLVTNVDLQELGVSTSAISRRVARGFLVRKSQGVYAVGREVLTQRGRHRAALLSVGDEACLSHFAAAEHRALMSGESVRIDITTTRKGLRQRPGLRIHCVRSLAPHEVTTYKGLRVTSVARTLLDLAGLVSDKTLMDLCARAAAKHLYNRIEILAMLGRGRRGCKALRRVLATFDVGQGHTKRELEHAFRRLIERHDIAPPIFNARIAAGDREISPDALWRELRFVVELDSREFHDNDPAFYTDREKDLLYEELGLASLRLTWNHVVGEEARIASVLKKRVGTASG
jgi:hypothetical protein